MSQIDQAQFFQLFGGSPLNCTPAGSWISGRELGIMMTLISGFRCRRIVELGVGEGANASAILCACPWIIEYQGIDVPAGFRPTLSQQVSEVPVNAGWRVSDGRFKLTISEHGTRYFDEEPIPEADFVFIDADHSEIAVRHDTRLARTMLRSGGICCWHDYYASGNQQGVGVAAVVHELNRIEGNHICHVVGTRVCFEIRHPSL